MKEKKDRVDDALCATRAAIEEGIVAGGGITYIRCIKSLNNLRGMNEDINIGINIIRSALEAPLRQIVSNAGQEPTLIVNEILNGSEDDYGYDAKNGKFVDMKEVGIIDPAKVTRTALENAASVAGLFLTTECVICNNNDTRNI